MDESLKNELWGEIKDLEAAPQITRSMMELTTPIPFETKNVEVEESRKNVLGTAGELIELQGMINTVEKIQMPSHAQFTKIDEILTLKSQGLPTMPAFKTEDYKSESTAMKMDFNKIKFNSTDRNIPEINNSSAKALLKKSAARLAAQIGFAESTSSTLDVIAEVFEAYIERFSVSLRRNLDEEAVRGYTSYYDVLDTACHESGIGPMNELSKYWDKDVVLFNKSLQHKINELTEKLKTLKETKINSGRNVSRNFKVNIAQERNDGFNGTYGKWTPIGNSGTPQYTATSWTNQNVVKTENVDTNVSFYPMEVVEPEQQFTIKPELLFE